WELYLRRLGVRIPLRDSFGIFLSGFSLTVTPGKIGEVLKSYLLREVHGVPMARTAPIVIAERLTDLVALAALALVGVGALAGGERVAQAVHVHLRDDDDCRRAVVPARRARRAGDRHGQAAHRASARRVGADGGGGDVRDAVVHAVVRGAHRRRGAGDHAATDARRP